MIVYLVRNKKNGKVYVGQTTKTVEVRWKAHLNESKRSKTFFYKAIRKYGADNFSIETIDTASSIEELNKKEEEWIKHYNALDQKVGYNLQPGGSNRTPHEITRARMRAACIGRKPTRVGPHSESTKQKIREKALSRPSKRIGMKHSEESKKRMSEIAKGRKVSEGVRLKIAEANKKKWQDDSFKKRHAESMEIARAKMDKAAMSLAALKSWSNSGEERRKNTSERFKGKKKNPEHLNKMTEGMLKAHAKPFEVFRIEQAHKQAPIIVIEALGVWNNISTCARELGLRDNCINSVLHGSKKTHKGYTFKYIDPQPQSLGSETEVSKENK